MKASSLKGIAVIDLSTAEKVGNVSEIILDPNSRRALGLEIKGERFGSPQVILVDKVHSFGKDAVTIENTSGFNERANMDALRGMPDLGQFTATRLVTDTGTLLGTVKDVMLSDDGKQILEYEYTSGGIGRLFGRGNKTLAASPAQRYGGSLITVPEAETSTESPEPTSSEDKEAAPDNAQDQDQ